MEKPKRTTKQSSNSGSIKPSASAEFKIKKSEPAYPEDYINSSNEVDRDTLAETVGSHVDIPESSSVASVSRTEGDHSDSETSSKGCRNNGKDDRSIESEDEGEVTEPDPLNLPELVGLDPTSLEQRFQVSRYRTHKRLH